MRPVISRSVTRALIAVGALLLVHAALNAHDFWLVPIDFDVEPGTELVIHGQTSSRFPTSEAAVAVNRIADAKVLSADTSVRITDFSHSGTSLVLRARPEQPGQRVVAVALHWQAVRESAEGFRRYLELEGAAQALATLQRQGRLPTDSITRRYAKYAKTIVEVGRGGARAYLRVAGHPLEFVPLRDPETLGAGDTVPVRLLYGGRALAGAHVHAGPAPRADEAPHDHELVTDTAGILRLPILRSGLWNLRTIHVTQAPAGSGADWETHWASLVFRVHAPARAGSADSAAVAAVVDRFHRALATGDSATAMSLLAPGAVVLESGGLESRDEYRAHHLPADIAFARAIASQRAPLNVHVRGDVAWAYSTSTTQGTYRDRSINSAGAELMVLERRADGWRITAIHWSSRTRR